MGSLSAHWSYLEGEWRGLQASPLSRRKAMLVAMLIDAFVDRLFAANTGADDILVHRAAAAARSPALDQIMALCAGHAGFAVVTEAVAVPLADYGTLGVEDFMVSLYNDHSVQRLLLTLPNGGRWEMLDLLDEAIAALERPADP